MTFAELYEAKKQASENFWEEGKTLDEAWRKACWDFFKTKFPKSKAKELPWGKLEKDPDFLPIRVKWEEKAKIMTDSHYNAQYEMNKELNRLAQEEEIPTTEELNIIYTVWTSDFSSQGYGASKYAKESAQNYANKCIFQNLKAEVKPTDQGYGVYTNTTEIGWDMIQRRPGPSLKEWIKSCWKAGTNPRVYNPFLPYGIEEKLGLDYFGNEIQQKGTVS